MRSRPVKPRATRIADMVASVPEFTRRTIWMEGTAPQMASAISTSRSVGAPKLVPLSNASRKVSRIAGCRWPSSSGPQEPT